MPSLLPYGALRVLRALRVLHPLLPVPLLLELLLHAWWMEAG